LRKLAGKIILIINIIAALLLLLSYSAPFINPSLIAFPAFLGLAYPFILLINILFLIYWIVRFRKEFFISFVVIIIGWGHLMNLMPINPENRHDINTIDNGELISVMSYNVRTFDQYNWNKNSNSVQGIFQIIEDQSPDIICFQEFLTANRPGMRETDLKKNLKDYPHNVIYYSLKSGQNSGFGVATFSKFPILKTSRIPFNNSMNQAVYSDIKMGSDTIRIFNIHLQSIRFRENNYAFMDSLSLKYTNRQLEEVKEIGHRLKDAFVLRAEQSRIIDSYIKDSPYPVIVTGDFNDTPLSFAYRKIKKGLFDAFREVGSGFGNTYAGDLPSFRIDFILYSKELEAIKFSRVKSKYSDHFPVSAVLRWRENRSE
jgi:endonuclease/exonuclease/phosphatase family metal-dependent hydrolase